MNAKRKMIYKDRLKADNLNMVRQEIYKEIEEENRSKSD